MKRKRSISNPEPYNYEYKYIYLPKRQLEIEKFEMEIEKINNINKYGYDYDNDDDDNYDNDYDDDDYEIEDDFFNIDDEEKRMRYEFLIVNNWRKSENYYKYNKNLKESFEKYYENCIMKFNPILNIDILKTEEYLKINHEPYFLGIKEKDCIENINNKIIKMNEIIKEYLSKFKLIFDKEFIPSMIFILFPKYSIKEKNEIKLQINDIEKNIKEINEILSLLYNIFSSYLGSSIYFLTLTFKSISFIKSQKEIFNKFIKIIIYIDEILYNIDNNYKNLQLFIKYYKEFINEENYYENKEENESILEKKLKIKLEKDEFDNEKYIILLPLYSYEEFYQNII